MRHLAGLSILRPKQVEVRARHQSYILWLYFEAILLYIKIVICVLACVPACVKFWIAYCVHTIGCSAAKFWLVVVPGGKCIFFSELGPTATDWPPSARDHVHHCLPLA